MKIKITVPEDVGLPRDIFPTEKELDEAIQIDRLVRAINEQTRDEAARFAIAVGHRLDRLERSVR